LCLRRCGTAAVRAAAPHTASQQPAAAPGLSFQHAVISSLAVHVSAWQIAATPAVMRLTYVWEADGSSAPPDTSALVGRCPSLALMQSRMPCTTAQLALLQRPTGLHTLAVGAGDAADLEGVQALCQLTGLQGLGCGLRGAQLTQLTRPTPLTSQQGRVHKELRWYLDVQVACCMRPLPCHQVSAQIRLGVCAGRQDVVCRDHLVRCLLWCC
jgi:hypothetical protein